MKENHLKTTISTMIKETNALSAENTMDEEQLDISHKDGVKFFGSLMERILDSIEKIENTFERIKEQL